MTANYSAQIKIGKYDKLAAMFELSAITRDYYGAQTRVAGAPSAIQWTLLLTHKTL